MKLNRKRVTLGIASLGLVGALAGGAGVALADSGTPAPAATAADNCPGHFGGMHGMAAGENVPMTAAAKYLGLSRTDLHTQMQEGKSLADIAKAQGKSVSGLKDAMVAGVKSNLDANTTLTADEKKAILAQVKSHIGTMVNTTHRAGAGMMGSMGSGMRGM